MSMCPVKIFFKKKLLSLKSSILKRLDNVVSANGHILNDSFLRFICKHCHVRDRDQEASFLRTALGKPQSTWLLYGVILFYYHIPLDRILSFRLASHAYEIPSLKNKM